MHSDHTQLSFFDQPDPLRCECRQCGKVFRKRQASAKGFYCSKPCKVAAQTLFPRGALTCPVCLSQFIRKGRKAGFYCSKGCSAVGQTFDGLLDRGWLHEQYVLLDRTSNEIAAEVGCDRKTVDNALRRLEIPMRPRGSHKNCRRIQKGDPSPWTGGKHTAETKRRMSEIAKAQGRIPYDPKVGPPLRGVHGPDHPNWKGGFTPERQAFYASVEWRIAARSVWARDRATCQRCEKKRSSKDGVPFDIHHIVSFAYRPLRAEITNLVLLCEPCHYWVHGKANVDSLFIKPIPEVLSTEEV